MPTLVSASDFLAIYSQFASLEVAKIEHYLDLSETTHCPAAKWEINGNRDRRKQGILLRTAHYLQVELLQNAYNAALGAAIQKGGSVPSPPNSQDLDTTLYGQQFKALQKKLPTRTGIPFRG